MSFFHKIQGKFDAQYHGRFLAHIICEVGRKQPGALVDFLSQVTGIPKRRFHRPAFQTEYAFVGRKGHKRYADLAVFGDQDDENPLVLVEIKYFDKLARETDWRPAQDEDYDYWRKTNNQECRSVVVLSREYLDTAVGVATPWGKLAKHLVRYTDRSELVQLLVDYLREEGVTVQNIDQKALLNFMKSVVCPSWGSGVLANNPSGPAEFGKLQLNLKNICGAFDAKFKLARAAGNVANTRGKVATVGCYFEQRLKSVDGDRVIDSDDMTLVDNQKDGGRIYVYARYALGHGSTDWLRLSLGFEIDVSPKEKPSVALYALASGNKLRKVGIREEKPISKLEDVTALAEKNAEAIEKKFHLLLARVIGDLYKKRSELKLTGEQKKVLGSLVKHFPVVQRQR